MLKIKYELEREDFALKQMLYKAKAVPDGYVSYTTEYTNFYEYINKQLQDAFDAGRRFERDYKPEIED